ncbi:hypothetical protein ACLOJK_022167 [Asimina triloba]
MERLGAVLMAVIVVVIMGLWKLFKELIWKPYAITKHFEKQGIRGPPYSFLTGNFKEIERLELEAKCTPFDPSSHDVTPKALKPLA